MKQLSSLILLTCVLAGCQLFEQATTSPPVANAGSNILNAVVGVEVVVHGEGSSGKITQYSWTFLSQPPLSTATLLDQNQAAARFKPDQPGDYTLQLTVANEGGSKSATVLVRAAAGEVPVTGVSLNKTSLSGVAGSTFALSATVLPDNATNKTVVWTSTDATVASVDPATGLVTFVKAGPVTIMAQTVNGNKFAFCAVTVASAPVPSTAIGLDKNTATLTVAGTLTLTATIEPKDATNQSVTWESLDTTVASVDPNGTIKGVAPGKTNILVTNGNFHANCSVTVVAASVPVTSINLNKNTDTLAVGTTDQLSASIVPANATDSALTWTSSDAAVVSVSSSGLITGVKAGTAEVAVKSHDGGFVSKCTVTVKAAAVAATGVSLNKNGLSLIVGGSDSLFATITPADATDQGLSWTSSNTGVATVTTGGGVSAVAVGNATITVTTHDGAKTAMCLVTVAKASVAVTGVSLNKNTAALVVGGSDTLAVSLLPQEATDQAVTWSSSNPLVASVSASGTVTGLLYGSADVTVLTHDGAKSATCKVTVSLAPVAVTGVTLNKNATSLVVGGAESLSAQVLPSGATDQAVTWTTSNSSIVTVSTSGALTGMAVGTAQVTATTHDGSKTATCDVTVAAATVAVTGVTLGKTTLNLTTGATDVLTPAISPSNATDSAVSWSTSNPLVASVSSTGTINAVAAGTTTVTVTTHDGAKTAVCTVTVAAATVAVTGVTLNKSTASLVVGNTEQLAPTVAPSNANDTAVTWASTSPSVASVSSTGVITALASGTTTITVTTHDGSKTATCGVTVVSIAAPVNVKFLAGNGYFAIDFPPVAGATKYRITDVAGTTVTAGQAGAGVNEGTVAASWFYWGRGNGTNYAAVVQASPDGGTTWGPASAVVTGAPSASVPTVTTFTPGDGTMKLDWANTLGATAYYLETRDGAWFGPFTTTATLTGLSNTALAHYSFIAQTATGYVMRYYHLAGDPVTGTNLLDNPQWPSGSLSPWTFTSAGSGWAAAEGGTNLWTSSYVWESISQTVDLTAKGLTATALSASTATFNFSVWLGGGAGFNAKYYLKLEALDSAGAVLDTVMLGDETNYKTSLWNNGVLTKVTLDYTNTGAKAVRKIRVTLNGRDAQNWGGCYGTTFTTPRLTFH